MEKSTAIIDNCPLQKICETGRDDRERLMNVLQQKFQLIAAFALIEETMIRLAHPAMGKPPDLYQQMKREIDCLYPWWMNDVVEIVFEEFVLRRPLVRFPRLSDDTVKELALIHPNDPDFIQAMSSAMLENERIIAERRAWQNTLIPTGKFYGALTEKGFFDTVVSDLRGRLADLRLKSNLLNESLGLMFRHRHPDFTDEIDHAFAKLNAQSIEDLPFTKRYLLLVLIYQFGPFSKVVSPLQQAPIIKRRGQEGNLADMHYLASSFLCDRLLTGDRDMAHISKIFRENGLWTGMEFWIDLKQDSAELVKQLSNIPS